MPSGLDEQTHATIIRALRLGLRLTEAAILAGVTDRTVRGWRRRGRQEHDGPYCRFAFDARRALAEWELACLSVIREAAHGREATTTKLVTRSDGAVERTTETQLIRHWQAAAWMLERRRPDKYARRWVKDDTDTKPPRVIATPLSFAPGAPAVDAPADS